MKEDYFSMREVPDTRYLFVGSLHLDFKQLLCESYLFLSKLLTRINLVILNPIRLRHYLFTFLTRVCDLYRQCRVITPWRKKKYVNYISIILLFCITFKLSLQAISFVLTKFIKRMKKIKFDWKLNPKHRGLFNIFPEGIKIFFNRNLHSYLKNKKIKNFLFYFRIDCTLHLRIF